VTLFAGSKELGDLGERMVFDRLSALGYRARLLPTNNPLYDIEVDASRPFRISVKTSLKDLHVRLGKLHMLRQMPDDDFVIALTPMAHKSAFDPKPGRHRVFVAPSGVARDDGVAVSEAWLAGTRRDGGARSDSGGAMLKFYKKSGLHPDVWKRWQTYENAWSILPPP
jgi:hypothetical protein